MRVVMLALGSRGDVQPFVALGLELERHGHRVTIAAAADYAPLAHDYDLAFTPLVGAIRSLVDPDAIARTARGGRLRLARDFLRDVPPIIVRLLRDVADVVRHADLVIVSSLGALCLPFLRDVCAAPAIVAHFHPAAPTTTRPQGFVPALPRWMPARGLYNRLSYAIYAHGQAQLLRPAFNVARHALSLPPIRAADLWRHLSAAPIPALYAYSPLVAPPAPNAEPLDAITGYWFAPAPPDWQPDDTLLRFLAADAPPVYIGFGSIMHGQQGGARLTQLVVEALRIAGLRGIIGRGWGDLGAIALPPFCLAIDDAPHGWLFQRVTAAVHHGGAGVTAAALRAGIPSLVVPFLGDQQLWAERVVALRAGLSSPHVDRLTAHELASSLRALVDHPDLRAGAGRISAALAHENGVATAARLIDRNGGTGACVPHDHAVCQRTLYGSSD